MVNSEGLIRLCGCAVVVDSKNLIGLCEWSTAMASLECLGGQHQKPGWTHSVLMCS